MTEKERPKLEELRRVIYVYSDGSKWEMLDVLNFVDNLQITESFTQSYYQMKPVRWERIK